MNYSNYPCVLFKTTVLNKLCYNLSLPDLNDRQSTEKISKPSCLINIGEIILNHFLNRWINVVNIE